MGKLKRSFNWYFAGLWTASVVILLSFFRNLQNQEWAWCLVDAIAETALVVAYFKEVGFGLPVCKLCQQLIVSEQDKIEWHGLGNCVPVCERCMGSGIEPANTSEEAKILANHVEKFKNIYGYDPTEKKVEGAQNGGKENSENIQIQKR